MPHVSYLGVLRTTYLCDLEQVISSSRSLLPQEQGGSRLAQDSAFPEEFCESS